MTETILSALDWVLPLLFGFLGKKYGEKLTKKKYEPWKVAGKIVVDELHKEINRSVKNSPEFRALENVENYVHKELDKAPIPNGDITKAIGITVGKTLT